MLSSSELSVILSLVIHSGKSHVVVSQSQVTALSLDKHPSLCVVESNSEMLDWAGSAIEPLNSGEFRLWTPKDYALTQSEFAAAKTRHEQRKLEYAAAAKQREAIIEKLVGFFSKTGMTREMVNTLIIRNQDMETLAILWERINNS